MFSVCVCVCVQIRYANRINTIRVSHASRKNPHFTPKSTPNTISLSYSTTVLFCPTNPCTKKITFSFPLRNSEFYFLFLWPPWVSIFCLPADEATAKSVKNNSPTDLEKQTAVASKDNGIFFLTKPLLCQIPTMLVKTPPISASLALLATVHV